MKNCTRSRNEKLLYSEKVECSHYAIAGNATVVNYQPLTIYLKNH